MTAAGTEADLATYEATCRAAHTVTVCEPWVMLCQTTKTSGLIEAIVLGKVIKLVEWAENGDAGCYDDDDRLWVFVTEQQWKKDCFLSPSQVYRALEKLEALGFVAQRRIQRCRNGGPFGNPVRHITLYRDVIGAAIASRAAGTWDPEATLRAVTSSRGRDETPVETSPRGRDQPRREGATRSRRPSSRGRDEARREGATSSSRGRDEPSRNKEELPTATTYNPTTYERESDDSSPPAADDARSRSVIDAFVRSVEDTPPPAPSEAVRLAELIRDRNNARNALYGINRSAAASPNSVKECDLLLRVGPTPNDGFKQERVSFEDVVRLVNYVFDHGEPEGQRGFSWAGQFQAGQGVRKNWYGAAAWMASRSNGHGNGRVPTLVPEDLADLSDLQLIELLKKGAELERVTAEMAARLADPVGQAETLARFRDLLGGADGWPRGTSGPINKARLKMSDWIRAKQAAGDQPALTRGA